MAEEWLIHVRDGFRDQNLDCSRKSDKVSIYKVPKFLIELMQSAYVPQMVSLGPLHHDSALTEMLAHKMHATRKMFASCYASNMEFEKKVIGPILKLVPRVLELELERNEAGAFSELCQLLDRARIARLFYPFLQKGIPHTQESKHLLDLIRMLVIDSSNPHKDTVRTSNCPGKQEIIIPSASELSRAGIKFTEVKGKFKGIRIQKNRFYLPRIRISSSIETLLRNLMALEICEADDTCEISRYVLLMCELIDSERDVHVLKKAGIIKSYMASDREVTDLFNRLSKGITRSYEDPFAKVREDAHKHYHSKIKVMIAEFADDHCSRPWRTVSVVGACMFLLLAAVQTIFSLHRKLLVN
ncbi:putative UPF0481 protein At3g02645 [Cryptomeria japonica]|uniref:putative UPF0481 protein At3g02645 n=1 Tax=Cryptomeria japonica TaxID=3369 RepID=UPI0025AD94CC|nr:putative UPF0481 protein At3g02645 [Cryptomeria japonica]